VLLEVIIKLQNPENSISDSDFVEDCIRVAHSLWNCLIACFNSAAR